MPRFHAHTHSLFSLSPLENNKIVRSFKRNHVTCFFCFVCLDEISFQQQTARTTFASYKSSCLSRKMKLYLSGSISPVFLPSLCVCTNEDFLCQWFHFRAIQEMGFRTGQLMPAATHTCTNSEEKGPKKIHWQGRNWAKHRENRICPARSYQSKERD